MQSAHVAHEQILATCSTCSSFLLDQDLTFYPSKILFKSREILSKLRSEQEMNVDPYFSPDISTI